MRWLLSTLYNILAFISKPGSFWIVLGVAIGLAYEYPQEVYRLSMETLHWPVHRISQEDLNGKLVVGLIAAAVGYMLTSKALSVVLGTFPPIMRPLRPQHRLRPRQRIIRPVKVTLAVPKLPRSRWKFGIEHYQSPLHEKPKARPTLPPAPSMTLPEPEQLSYEPHDDAMVLAEEKTS